MGGKKLLICENYKGVDIELWVLPNGGHLYHALIGSRHEFFDRYRDARIQIANSEGKQ